MSQADERSSRLLQFVKAYSRQHGRPPSMREIADAIGVKSTSLVNYYLNRLEHLGKIKRDKGIARGIIAT